MKRPTKGVIQKTKNNQTMGKILGNNNKTIVTTEPYKNKTHTEKVLKTLGIKKVIDKTKTKKKRIK